MAETATATGQKAFRLRVITPDRVVYDGEAVSIQVPAHDGYRGVLFNHAAMITPLGTGILRVEEANGQTMEMFVSNGFLQTGGNDARLVCDSGERADEIDLERARESEKRAREKLDAQRKAGVDRPRAEAALQRALLRERLAQKAHRKGPETGLR